MAYNNSLILDRFGDLELVHFWTPFSDSVILRRSSGRLISLRKCSKVSVPSVASELLSLHLLSAL